MNRIEKLLSFLQDSPHDSFLKHALALEYIKQGKSGAARTLFEEILEREPDYLGSYYQIAQLLERSGETDAATVWYQKGMAMAKANDNQKVYKELETALEELTQN